MFAVLMLNCNNYDSLAAYEHKIYQDGTIMEVSSIVLDPVIWQLD